MFDDIEVVVFLVFCEMFEVGFVLVGEFYYLYYVVGGVFYDDVVEFFIRIFVVV